MGQGSLKQKMSNMISNLSDRVKAAEIEKSPTGEFPSVSPSTWTNARNRVRHKSTLISDQHVSTAVRRKVAWRMMELHLKMSLQMECSTCSDKDQAHHL